MALYRYKARNVTGQVTEGEIRASDNNEAVRQLEAQGLLPLSIEVSATVQAGRETAKRARVADREIIIFTRQLAAMLRAGIPIIQALQVIGEQTADSTVRQITESARHRISGGARLSDALSDFPRVFRREYIHVVVSGESGADMVDGLFQLADWMEHDLEVMAAVKSAVRYPVLVIIALIAAMALAVFFIIPRFSLLYTKASVDLPLPTQLLMSASLWLNTHVSWFLVGIGLLATASIALYNLPGSRLKFDRFMLSCPVVGRLYTGIIIARFCRILSMLIRNGVPVIKALEVAAPVAGNLFLREAVELARNRIQQGSTITDGLAAGKAFPPMVMHLVAVGEKTGQLDNMLDFIVAQYDTEVRYGVKNLVSMIEPAMTLVVGVGVLFLALAVYLPIWNMSKIVR